jgi:hypothetical protein
VLLHEAQFGAEDAAKCRRMSSARSAAAFPVLELVRPHRRVRLAPPIRIGARLRAAPPGHRGGQRSRQPLVPLAGHRTEHDSPDVIVEAELNHRLGGPTDRAREARPDRGRAGGADRLPQRGGVEQPLEVGSGELAPRLAPREVQAEVEVTDPRQRPGDEARHVGPEVHLPLGDLLAPAALVAADAEVAHAHAPGEVFGAHPLERPPVASGDRPRPEAKAESPDTLVFRGVVLEPAFEGDTRFPGDTGADQLLGAAAQQCCVV